ncbi:MAG: FAD-dependent oxidoreductase [Oscillospiraceae bacterium]|nr:FAD-dependent oxidoreductase [Oscillospiraceae bacterium]
MKVIIVGGVAGGATAAARIRRLDEKAEIKVFERSGYVSYANCGLPYYIGDVITDPEDLTLQTPESFFRRFRVDMKTRHEVIDINPSAKTLLVKNLENGNIFSENYDKLILAPGAKPAVPPIPGVNSGRIFTLRTVEDTFKIKDFVNSEKPKSAVIIGGGFIGVELAENLSALGIETTIVEGASQLLSPFDSDMAAFIHSEIRRNKINLLLGSSVEGFSETGGGIDVLLKGGKIHADMVALAIGVSPENSLAKKAGLKTGIRGSIIVNEKMETSVPNIYAVGDAVQVKNFVTGEDALISLAGPANKQARIAADNICKIKNSVYKGSLGSSVIKIFSLTAASTGINEKTAKAAGIDFDKVILSPMSHAGYYPGGKVMTMKVLFEKKTFRLLGAQIIGYEGVDKRIDVIATAIKAKMKATELKELDLSYAPPYSSAKDPVNMAGFMIDNIANGTLKQWFIPDLEKLPKTACTLLDTRTVKEFERGHIEGFKNIPVDELRERLSEIEPGKPVYVICQSGLRSYIASRILEGNGFTAYNFAGGFRFYDTVMNDKSLIESSFPCGMDK